MHVCLVALLGCLLFSITANADAVGDMMHVVEVFTLPALPANELISQNLSGPDFHARLIELVEAKSATLDHLMIMRAKSVQRASVEQVDQYRYPTEYDPPQVPNTLAIIDSQSKTASPPAAALPPEPMSPFNAGLGIMSTTTATAFEMRPLGARIELDAAIDSNGVPTVNYVLDLTELASVRAIGDIPLPAFSAAKIEGTVSPKLGAPTFLGSCSYARNTGVQSHRVGANTSFAFLTTRRVGDAAAATSEPAPDPFGTKKTATCRITLEVVSLPKGTVHGLILETLDDATLHDRIVALIEKNEAVRETMICLRARSGLRASVDNVDEHIEPTEFDPPQLPQTLILGDHDLISDLRAGNQVGVGGKAAADPGHGHGGFGLITSLSPTAFEMQPIGERMEVDFAQVGDIAAVSFSAELNRRAGVVRYGSIDHMMIETQKLVTSVELEFGHTVLLGTMNKPLRTGAPGSNTGDRIWLAFLRVQKK